MIARSFIFSMLLALPSLTLFGQEDTAHHRKVYQSINDATSKSKPVKATFKDEPLIWDLQGWKQEGQIVKILAEAVAEDGGGKEEYYYEKGEVIFVYRTYNQHGANGKPFRVEDRFYFKGGKLWKWLGMDKQPVTEPKEDINAEEGRLKLNAVNFINAFKTSPKWDGKTKPVASPVQSQEGTFLKLEQGDYFYWTMRLADKSEVTYWLLRPDESLEAVIQSPTKFAGKKCRVQWQRKLENLPEAGGKLEVNQILSVEWLPAK
jgi:hypothetical protein